MHVFPSLGAWGAGLLGQPSDDAQCHTAAGLEWAPFDAPGAASNVPGLLRASYPVTQTRGLAPWCFGAPAPK
jgi:hypothetical protein